MENQPALQTFIAESLELLHDMEEALLQLEKKPEDPDALNAVFRAVHTIKGSSGMFGFDDIVAFTHLMESVLVDVRADEIIVDASLTALMLSCKDHLALLIDHHTENGAELDDAERDAGLVLAAELEAYLKFPAAIPEAVAPVPEPVVESMGSSVVSSNMAHFVALQQHPAPRDGSLSFIHFLGTLGEVLSVVTLFDLMPDASQMDPNHATSVWK